MAWGLLLSGDQSSSYSLGSVLALVLAIELALVLALVLVLVLVLILVLVQGYRTSVQELGQGCFSVETNLVLPLQYVFVCCSST